MMRTATTIDVRSHGAGVHVLAAIGAAILLHYAITPAESGGSGLALHVRFAVAMAGGLAVLVINADQPAAQRLLVPLCMLALWILLLNVASDTWYGVMFAAFAAGSVILSTAFVVGPLQQKFLLALDLLLVLWVGVFLMQFLIYFGTGSIIDFHAIFHPYSAARIFAEGDSGVFRFTGPHIEPGSYANWVYGLVILRSIARRRWFDFVGMAAMASTMLSFSLWAMVGAAAYFAGAIFHSLSSLRLGAMIRILMALILIVAVFSWFASSITRELIEYLILRSTPDDGSSSSKFLAWQGFIREFWDVLLIGTSFEHDYCDGCASPQDAGTAINMVMRVGLIATLCILFPIIRTIWGTAGVAGLIAFLPLLFAKFYVFDPIFWMIVGVCAIDWTRATASYRPAARSHAARMQNSPSSKARPRDGQMRDVRASHPRNGRDIRSILGA